MKPSNRAGDLSLRFGQNHARQLIVIEPLFEEANRLRRVIANMMRHLDTEGIGTKLPSLPGTSESLEDVGAIDWADWQQAIADYSKGCAGVISFRGGSLLDLASGLPHRWRFAPESGARLVRDLRRTQLAGHGAGTALYAGNALSDALLTEIEAAALDDHADIRTVRLLTDAQAADLKVDASPLWRRAEPGDDPALSALLAADVAQWIRSCAA